MFPSGSSMTGFTPQQWAAAFASMTGQPAAANNHAFHIGGVDSNSVVLSAVAPGYVRFAQNASQPSVLSGSPLPPNPYASHHPTLGYTIQPSMENPVAGRQLAPANITPSYPLQHYPPTGAVSQTVPYPHNSLPYELSYPYIPPLLPSLCNGGLTHVQQCPAIPPQQQAALVSGLEPNFRVFDSLKSFGALPQDQSRRTKPMITSKTNLYISGLNESDTDESVRSLVKDIVQPKSCKAMISNGVCKGYGFIDCATEEDAERAKNHIMEYAKITGRKLLVKFAHENEKDVLNVYVRHLPLDFTKEKLEELFRKYGQITSVKLLENEDRLTGIGFVRYALAEQAERAIEQMNAEKLILGNNTAPVMCKLADKANTRRRAMATHPTSTLMLQQSFPMNPIQRHNVSMNNPASSQRGSGSIQAQQSAPLAPAVPFTTQLISTLNQPQVILQNMPATPASHARNVLTSGFLPNCSSGSSLLPISFASVAPAISCASTSNRSTPLIGPPPTTSISICHNQNAAANVAVTHITAVDSTHNTVSKVAVSNIPTSKFLSIHAGSTYFRGDGAALTDPTASSSLQSSGVTAINSQSLVFPHASNGCNNHTSAASVFSTFTSGTLATQCSQTFISTNSNKTAKITEPILCSQSNPTPAITSTLESPITVTVVESDLQRLSLKMSPKQLPTTLMDVSQASETNTWDIFTGSISTKVDETSETQQQCCGSCTANSSVIELNSKLTTTQLSGDHEDDLENKSVLDVNSTQGNTCTSESTAPVEVPKLTEVDEVTLAENHNGVSFLESDCLDGTCNKRPSESSMRKFNDVSSGRRRENVSTEGYVRLSRRKKISRDPSTRNEHSFSADADQTRRPKNPTVNSNSAVLNRASANPSSL